jgi:Dolichyl-phosphate-mannose-protein mannosyltransferase
MWVRLARDFRMRSDRKPLLCAAAVIALLGILFVELLGVNVRTSMSWDEGHHLFDGYTILTHRDFGLNPEVPPLAKMVAALPVLPMSLYVPTLQRRDSQLEAFTDGRDFLFRNDANALLLRGRLAISLFTVALGLMVFLAGRELFGATAGLLALAFLVFDPTLLAHGALVTTDAAITSIVFAAVYSWIRYTNRPSVFRLALAASATGLAFAVKFTGLFLIPVLALIVMLEAWQAHSLRLLIRRALSLAVVFIAACAILWASYGFRYAARPAGMVQNPALAQYLETYSHVANPHSLQTMAHYRVLPEAYIWGLANTKLTEERDVSYIFGRIHRHGVWYYFPAAIAIKSTLPFLLLMALAIFVWFRNRELRLTWATLLIPVAVFLAMAMHSDMNIGVRHILPIYPFLYLIGASALSVMIGRDRRWIIAAAVLLFFQAVTSLRAFPGYVAYANEAWGGPTKVHKYLGDSNSDWGQQLKTAAKYLRKRGITDCWMSYTASGVADERYYGVPCKPLPTIVNLWWIPVPMSVPKTIDGVVLISDDELEGIDQQFGNPSPYAAFKTIKPTAVLDGGLFVYEGHFDMSAASGIAAYAQAKMGGSAK